MLEGCIVPFRFANHYLAEQLKTIDLSQARHVPHDGLKTPLWLVGHLAAGTFYTGAMLGKPVCPDFNPDWLAFFGPGTDAANVAEEAPSIEALRDVILGSEQAIIDEVTAADESDYQESHGLDLLLSTPLQTKADLIAHLMTTHYTTHLGELAIWRRVMGLPPLF